MQYLGPFPVGLIIALVISTVAHRVGMLTFQGALGAALVGALTFGFGGLIPALLLILFFISSNVFTRLGSARKFAVGKGMKKGERRDLYQVFANGGLPAAFAVLYGVYGDICWLVALTGALAAVTADTWATELGVLAGGSPRLITSGEIVEPGTSGGVTITGSMAAIVGSILIGVIAGLSYGEGMLGLAVSVGGLTGAFWDSLLGASVQVMYVCPSCDKETERYPRHTCGAETRWLRGWRWLNNDGVNFLSAMVGAGVALILWR